MKVICQRWEESEKEPDWGVTVRPDGYSFHRTSEDLARFIQAYWAKLPGTPGNPPSDDGYSIYSRPCGAPYECEIADTAIISLLTSSGLTGVRVYNNYPTEV